MQTCTNCKFMVDMPVDQSLQRQKACVRFPPSVNQMQGVQGGKPVIMTLTTYPTVNDGTIACGEYLLSET